jgi:hypothetical protein
MKKNYFIVVCFLIVCYFTSCNTCDEDHCKAHTSQKAIEIRCNTDSLNGGFTKAQIKNVFINYIDFNGCSYADSVVDSSLYIYHGGSIRYKFITIKNNNTSTRHDFKDFHYSTDEPDCCEALQNHTIISLLFDGNFITPASTPLIIIDNN